MKNKQNEANDYDCVLCETGEGERHGSGCSEDITYLDSSTIEKWRILAYIREVSKTKSYIEEQKLSGEDPNSEFDSGYDAALDGLLEFIGDIKTPYKRD